MYKYEMPEWTDRRENNKMDPYPLLSEGMKRVIDYQAEHAKDAFDTNCTWEVLREKYVEERKFWNEGGPEPYKVVNMEVEGPIGPIPVRLYYPDDKPGHNVCVFFHGGGFTVGSIDTHDRIMRAIMEAAGCVVIGVDYTLSPEAQFPVPVYECATVVRYFHENAAEYDLCPDNMAMAGDSGGGTLSMSVNLYLRDAFGGNDYIAALLLYYGFFGMSDSVSYRLHGTPLDGMTMADMYAYQKYYLGDDMAELENPYNATLNNDLTYGMPATYMCCGDLDPLLGNSQALDTILRNHGVRTELEIMPGCLHAYMHYSKMMDEAVHCLKASGEFYKSVLEDKKA